MSILKDCYEFIESKDVDEVTFVHEYEVLQHCLDILWREMTDNDRKELHLRKNFRQWKEIKDE